MLRSAIDGKGATGSVGYPPATIFRRRTSQSGTVGPARRASILNALAVDELLDDANTARAGDALLAGANPLFNDRVEGESEHESDIAAIISAESRRKASTRHSLTEGELQQVLEHIAPVSSSKPSMSKRRISAATAGAAVVGSSKALGARSEKYEEMQKFMEHLRHQARATYVPIGCAEKILEEASTNAEATNARHQHVIVTLEATYREIDEKTRRHYEGLILRLQVKMRAELHRLAKEKKEQEEEAENLRDKIASQTAAAAAREVEIASQREQDRLSREKEAAEFTISTEKLVEESRRVLKTAMEEAKKASEAAMQDRLADMRRRSMQRVGLEDETLRAAVALTLADAVSAVEEREHARGREDLQAELAAAGSETGLLRAELAEAVSSNQSLLAKNFQLGQTADSLREEAVALTAELEERSKALAATEASLDAAGESLRAHLEEAEAAAMMEHEYTFTALLELVRHRREAKELSAKVTDLSRLLEEEQAVVRKLLHEAEALPGSGGGGGGGGRGEVSGDGGEEAAAADGALSDRPRDAADDDAERERSVSERAIEDVVAEKKALEAEAADNEALSLSMRRVAELEAQATSLKHELAVAKQKASDTLEAKQRSHQQKQQEQQEQQQLTPAEAAAAPSKPETAPAPVEESSAVVVGGGGGVGLTVEKGPSLGALRLEEIKAELQRAVAAKKKVKGGIKVWLKDFEEKEGRPASNEDKMAIKDQFVDHNRLEKATAKLTREIEALEAEIAADRSLTAAAAAREDGEEGATTVPNTPSTPTTGSGFGAPALAAGFHDARSEAIDTAADTAAAAASATAAAELQELREENASLAERLKESERKKALLKTALEELNNTTTKMLADVHPRTATLDRVPSSTSPGQVASDVSPLLQKETSAPSTQALPATTQEEHLPAAAEDAKRKERELELEENLRSAKEEAREAILAAKKSEHLKEEASLALEVAKDELKACRLVVDEASEAARLREQLEVLKVDLEAKSRAAVAGWDAAANAESEAEAAEARGRQAGIKSGRADAERTVRALQEELSKLKAAASATSTASAAATAATTTTADAAAGADDGIDANAAITLSATELYPPPVGALDTDVVPTTPGALETEAAPASNEGGVPPTEWLAKDLEIAERELKNLREREQDARGEVERLEDELQRASAKQERQRQREADLVNVIASLEKEKNSLSRGLEMAEERAALALELVAAHNEEAAKARQESALNAAKFRRVSRDIAQAASSGSVPPQDEDPAEESLTWRSSGARPMTSEGRPATSLARRRAAEQLRLAAATLVHAIKEGTDLWRRRQRTECHALYVKAGGRAVAQMPPGQAADDLRIALAAAKGLTPVKAAIALRKAFDTVIEAAMAAKEGLGAPQEDAAAGTGNGLGSNRASTSSAAGGRGLRTSRGDCSPPFGSVSPSRNTSTTATAAKNDAAADASTHAGAIAAAAAAAAASVDTAGGGGPGLGSEPHDSASSKVASLQRQLDALSARQREAQAAAVAVSALSSEGSSDDGGGESGEARDRAGNGGWSMLEIATRKCSEMEDKIYNLEAECRNLREALDEKPVEVEGDDVGNKAGASPPGRGGGGDDSGTSHVRARADQLKIKFLEQKHKEEVAKAKKLEALVAKLESTMAESASGAATVKAPKADNKAAEMKAKAAEAKTRKEIEQAEAKNKKLAIELETALKGLESSKNELAQLKKESDDLRRQVSTMGSMGEEIKALRVQAEEAVRLGSELQEAVANTKRLEGLYQVEQGLRKKYWNMMEDMKGKIRVFARCRPFAQYELNQDCKRAVRFLDETTVEVDGQHGPKQFVFDSVFSEERGQADIFEDTRNLVQSALDGFNVCVFAYGQTGSGKTWTMTGGKGDQRGLTPRVIEEIFGNIDRSKSSIEAKVSCYFIELYLDNLRDLLFAMENPRGTPPKLEIHLDSNKMVVVKNVVTKEVANASELMNLFTAGNQQRKVGGTKMNAESSRSHSVFSILVEVYNKTSKKTTTGKLSLVDLAGSERADKTGATAERLKEAQSINKSLSALGDVISALSTNEKFIPYRNNKLTQVMQDSLGGNAKTLMFVNISPADYNQDETVTALTYATRVKLITNSAEKQQDGEEVSRLKETIRKLRAGESEDGDGKQDVNG